MRLIVLRSQWLGQRRTLHAMGIISCSTGCEDIVTNSHYIKRRKRKLVGDVIVNMVVRCD